MIKLTVMNCHLKIILYPSLLVFPCKFVKINETCCLNSIGLFSFYKYPKRLSTNITWAVLGKRPPLTDKKFYQSYIVQKAKDNRKRSILSDRNNNIVFFTYCQMFSVVHDKPWKLYKGGNLKWANRKKWCLSWHEKKGVNFHKNLFRGLQVADRSNQEKNLSQSKMSSLMVGIYYYIHVVIWFFFSFDMNYFVLEDYCSSLSNTQHGNLFLLKALFR